MGKGLNIETVQNANRCLILRLMLDNIRTSRKELAEQSGLRKATISNIIKEFHSLGIVNEQGYIAGEGRRVSALELSLPWVRVISMRITSKNYIIAVFDIWGNLEYQIERSIDPSLDVRNMLIQIDQCMQMVINKMSAFKIIGMSVALPGPYVRSIRNIAIVTGFEQLSKVDIQKTIQEQVDFPVFSEHDAKLSAFAEWKNVDSDEPKMLVGLQSIGVGLGAGIIMDGRIVQGAYGIAGELGHMGINFNANLDSFGNKGSFEHYAAVDSLHRYVSERAYEFPDSVIGPASDYSSIVNAYAKGDDLAAAAMNKLAWMIGYGLAGIVFVINPDVIVIGAEYPRNNMFLDKIIESVKQRMHPEIYQGVQIKLSQLETDPTLLGGYYFVIDNLLREHTVFEQIKEFAPSYANDA